MDIRLPTPKIDETLLPRAEAGDIQAQYELGMAYQIAFSSFDDVSENVPRLLLAQETELEVLYHDPDFDPKEETEGFELDMEDNRDYLSGLSGEIKDKRAKYLSGFEKWMVLAGEAGHIGALEALADFYQSDRIDGEKAKYWETKLAVAELAEAKAGDVHTCFKVATQIMIGRSSARDAVIARDLIMVAISSADEKALQNELGYPPNLAILKRVGQKMFFGEGMDEDMSAAIPLFRLAAGDLGGQNDYTQYPEGRFFEVEAVNLLADCHAEGLGGVERNIERAEAMRAFAGQVDKPLPGRDVIAMCMDGRVVTHSLCDFG